MKVEETLNQENPDVIAASAAADAALITSSGRCNWEAISILRSQGYGVWPGEQDSCGWLVGCIQTLKGVLYFG